QLPLIKYTVFVDPARVSGTFINIAEIDSGAIGGGIKQARYQLTILPDFGLDVLKTVDKPIHQVNSPFSFNLVYKNLGGDDFTTGEFIDILPYNGDADPGVTTGGINSNRDPESNYNGIYDISAVSRSNGETFFATIADPATIEEDPCHASNLPLGFDPSIPSGVCSLYYAREGTLPGGGAVGTNSSNWVQCTTLDPLVCGALDNTDITAIKFTAPTLLAAGGGQTVTIEFEPVGNLGGTPDLDSEGKVTAAITGDIYTNTFGGRVSEISLNVISNDVSVTLVSGSIGDTVWFDLDADGNGPTGAGDESDITEPPIVGAQVALLDASGDPVLIDPDTGAVVTAGYVNPVSGNPAIPYITTTDGSGQYQFDNLPAGTYSVEVTPPLGATPTIDADGIGTPNISTHDLTPVTDAAGQLIGVEDNVDQDFGYTPPLQVGSTVWLDINNDGTQATDGTEPGIAGITVQLFREGDDPLTATPVATAVTDGNGDYIMNTGSAGNYFIYIPVPPADATLSSSDIVSSSGDNGVDADDNGLQASAGDSVQSPVFNLNYGTEPIGPAENGLTGGAQDDALDNNGDMTIDFGFYPTGSIGDLVMIDIDGDGVLDPGDGDAGIGGVTVTLQYTDLDGQSVTLTTMTALDGSYLFDNLPGNVTYTVTVDTTTLPGTLGDDIRASYDADGGLDNTSQTTLDIVANQVVDDLDQDFGYV
ncbi:MAG: hypothetical protein KAG66_17955, partial [Methylococcales bacterium]|nr:hypothetical protein [Methylococcales bacterium]